MSTNKADLDKLQASVANSLHEHWRLFLAEGIMLSILGLLAIIVPQIATIAVAVFIGWLLLLSGIVGLIATLRMRSAPGFGWSLVSALLGIVAGIVLLVWPLSGALSLTMILTVFLVIEGVASILLCARAQARAVRTMGRHAIQRHRRFDFGGHHIRGPARRRGMGDRSAHRHQLGVRRQCVDRMALHARGNAPA